MADHSIKHTSIHVQISSAPDPKGSCRLITAATTMSSTLDAENRELATHCCNWKSSRATRCVLSLHMHEGMQGDKKKQALHISFFHACESTRLCTHLVIKLHMFAHGAFQTACRLSKKHKKAARTHKEGSMCPTRTSGVRGERLQQQAYMGLPLPLGEVVGKA